MDNPAVGHLNSRDSLGLGDPMPLVQRLQSIRRVEHEVVALVKEARLLPAALEGLVAELLRRLGQETTRDWAVGVESDAMLAEDWEQPFLRQPRNSAVATLKDGWKQQALLMADVDDLLDLFGGVIGEAKTLDRALLVKGVET